MGCDIHMYAEVKHYTDWKRIETEWRPSNALFLTWSGWESEPFTGRFYTFFAELADVRNRDQRLARFPHRGIPDDSPHKKHLAADDEWYHSHSWASLKELEDTPWSEDVEAQAWTLIERLRKLGPPDRVRVVFAFDN